MDASFGDRGSLVSRFDADGESTGLSLRRLCDGRILVFGLHYPDDRRTLPAVARFFADGRPDRRFGSRGVQLLRLPGDLSEGPVTAGCRRDWRASRAASVPCSRTAGSC